MASLVAPPRARAGGRARSTLVTRRVGGRWKMRPTRRARGAFRRRYSGRVGWGAPPQGFRHASPPMAGPSRWTEPTQRFAPRDLLRFTASPMLLARIPAPRMQTAGRGGHVSVRPGFRLELVLRIGLRLSRWTARDSARSRSASRARTVVDGAAGSARISVARSSDSTAGPRRMSVERARTARVTSVPTTLTRSIGPAIRPSLATTPVSDHPPRLAASRRANAKVPPSGPVSPVATLKSLIGSRRALPPL